MTDLGSDFAVDPSKAGTSDEIRALSERLRMIQESGGSNQRVATAMASLAEGISGLVKNMRNEQQMMRDWIEAQSDEQKRLRETLERVAAGLDKQKVN